MNCRRSNLQIRNQLSWRASQITLRALPRLQLPLPIRLVGPWRFSGVDAVQNSRRFLSGEEPK
jgi:hypothetical protein